MTTASSETKILLEASSLSHSYEYSLFENIDLNLQKQKSVAIVGVSGSGKSTLLHILSSFLTPNSGVVKILNSDIYNLNSTKLIELRRKYIGIIFQQHYLFKGFSVLENLKIGAMIANLDIDYELLENLGLSKILDTNVSDISGGEQQRVSIARVLMKKPKIIFGDELTGNLDDGTTNNVVNVILDYIKVKNAAAIFVTHNHKVADMCDATYELKNTLLRQIS